MRRKVEVYMEEGMDVAFASVRYPMPRVLDELGAAELHEYYPEEVEIAFYNYSGTPPMAEECDTRADDLLRYVNAVFDGYPGLLLLGPDELPERFLRHLKIVGGFYGIDVCRAVSDSDGEILADDDLGVLDYALCPCGKCACNGFVVRAGK